VGKFNIREAKTKLVHLLRKSRRGERKTRARPIGRARGEFQVPAAFFEPLPEDEVRAFEGRSS